MNFMQRKYALAVTIVAAALIAALVVHFIRTGAEEKPNPQVAEKSDAPTASIKTDILKQGEISQSTEAFGSVISQPGAVAVFSVPYECRVNRILVTAGQPIDNGADLIEIEPSPGAKLALQEAQSNLSIASQDLIQTQQRFDMKLGTNTELLQSQQAVKLAQLRLDNLKGQGLDSGDHRLLRTDSPGLVARVDAQQGQIVPPGNPVIETIARDQVEVRLGVEPASASHLAIGQAVHLFSSSSVDPINGKIRLITQRVNPDTRLVDIFVTPDSRDGLLLDAFIRAELTTDTKSALIAPHDAVLPDDDGYTLFTVKDGLAVKHTVTLGLQNDKEVAVTADDLHAGDAAVVVGNLELEDKMPVTTEETK